jgi:Fe-S cluster assembly protein SufD
MSRTLLINPTAMEAGLIAAAKARAFSPRRAAAFARFSQSGLPHKRIEGWKWTDVRAVLREPLPAPEGDNDVIAPSIFGEVDPFEITIMNGEAEWSGQLAGVSISSAAADREPLDHPLGALAIAMSEAELNVRVAENARIGRPILIRRIAGPGTHHALASVKIERNASARVIESFHGIGRYFSNSGVAYRLGEGAALERFILQDASADGVETALATAQLKAGARLAQTSLLFGAKLARMETRIVCEGAGADIRLVNASLVGAMRHADLATHVRLDAPGAKVRQTHKAAIAERGHGVFQGKFLCARAAQKTDARMEAHALLLSDQAEADHKPELEIYADDVVMSHGSTAGALDADAIFYLRQRGLEERAARALLTEAFIGSVFDELADERMQAICRRRLTVWLESAR